MADIRQEIARGIGERFRKIRAYRALAAMERKDGNEIEARRYQRYGFETLRDIRMLRESVR